MIKNSVLIVLCFGLILVMGVAVFLLVSSLRQPALPPSLPPVTAVDTQHGGADESYVVPLYFLSSDNRFLVRERRPVVLEGKLEERLVTIVEELLRGPRLRNLLPTAPPGTRLQSLFWDEAERRVVLSLSREFLDRRPGHAMAEWASIYSIVNAVADHDGAIRSVQILVDGEIVEDGTLWDLSEPFVPDRTFVLYVSAETENNPG